VSQSKTLLGVERAWILSEAKESETPNASEAARRAAAAFLRWDTNNAGYLIY